MAKSAIDKIRDKSKQPKIVPSLPSGINWAHEGASMVVSTPMEVDELMKGVPASKLTTADQLREKLARHYKTDFACPMSTGIFINISAKAASEMLEMGAEIKEVTPYWRTLKSGGELNPKFPGGLEGHAAKLEAEGFTVFKKGKNKWLVEDFEQFLI